MSEALKTPLYIFSAESFRRKALSVKEMLPDVPLTFSVKANPFLISALPGKDIISHVEVCSPGELAICRELGVEGERIIYSGVMKEEADIGEALSLGVKYITAESRRHYDMIASRASSTGKRARVLLRLTCGNQFGMSEEEIMKILSLKHPESLSLEGVHYYSGTAKKKAGAIKKDLERIGVLLERAEKEAGFIPSLVEYGPGLSAEYYEPPYEEKDKGLLSDILPLLSEFKKKYTLGIEMGRFMASDAGAYHTRVMDIKVNDGVNYVIADGGVHQLKYYGQNMAMKIPPLKVMREGKVIGDEDGEKKPYSICGSLCTVADVLVREVLLPELKIGDILVFERCGAYSVSEGALLFLSRDMPEIWLEDNGSRLLRPKVESYRLNLSQ